MGHLESSICSHYSVSIALSSFKTEFTFYSNGVLRPPFHTTHGAAPAFGPWVFLAFQISVTQSVQSWLPGFPRPEGQVTHGVRGWQLRWAPGEGQHGSMPITDALQPQNLIIRFNLHSNARICVREARRVRSKNNQNWQRLHRARCHKRCRPDGAEAEKALASPRERMRSGVGLARRVERRDHTYLTTDIPHQLSNGSPRRLLFLHSQRQKHPSAGAQCTAPAHSLQRASERASERGSASPQAPLSSASPHTTSAAPESSRHMRMRSSGAYSPNQSQKWPVLEAE